MDQSELHPDAQAYLEQSAEAPDLHTLSPEEAREFSRQMSITSGEPEPVGDVRNVVVRGQGHEIPVRVYVPDGDPPFPTLVWAHGGGFVIGDLDTADATARALTNAGECVVASVGYRLTPEHPFPAPQRDVYDATVWASEQIHEFGGDPDRLAVGGDSAGGTLAASTTLLARERDGPKIDYQLLVYPAVNYSQIPESYEIFADSFLGTDAMDWFDECYLSDPLHGYNRFAYPLEASDFSGLPPATVLTVGYDPLRDEGQAYADALADADVPVETHYFEDMIHGFIGMLDEPEWDRTREAIADIGQDLQDHLGN